MSLKVQFWPFLWNCHSSTGCLKKNSFESVDSWPKILLFRPYHLWNSTAELILILTQHGLRTLNEGFLTIFPNSWANWADRQNEFWCIWCTFGRTISLHFSTVNPSFSCVFFHKKLCFSDLTQLYPKYYIGRKEFSK